MPVKCYYFSNCKITDIKVRPENIILTDQDFGRVHISFDADFELSKKISKLFKSIKCREKFSKMIDERLVGRVMEKDLEYSKYVIADALNWMFKNSYLFSDLIMENE